MKQEKVLDCSNDEGNTDSMDHQWQIVQCVKQRNWNLELSWSTDSDLNKMTRMKKKLEQRMKMEDEIKQQTCALIPYYREEMEEKKIVFFINSQMRSSTAYIQK